MNCAAQTGTRHFSPLNVEALSPEKKQLFDVLTEKHTAFNSFEELVGAGEGYFPTIDTLLNPSLHTLADGYDAYMEAINDPRRAFRTDNYRAFRTENCRSDTER